MTSWLCPASRRIASSGISLGPAVVFNELSGAGLSHRGTGTFQQQHAADQKQHAQHEASCTAGLQHTLGL